MKAREGERERCWRYSRGMMVYICMLKHLKYFCCDKEEGKKMLGLVFFFLLTDVVDRKLCLLLSSKAYGRCTGLSVGCWCWCLLMPTLHHPFLSFWNASLHPFGTKTRMLLYIYIYRNRNMQSVFSRVFLLQWSSIPGNMLFWWWWWLPLVSASCY